MVEIHCYNLMSWHNCCTGDTAFAGVNKILHFHDGKKSADFILEFTARLDREEGKTITDKHGPKIFVPNESDFSNATDLMYIRVSYNSDRRPPEQFIRTLHDSRGESRA